MHKRGITKINCECVAAQTVKQGLKERNSLIRQVLPAKIMYYDFVEGVKADKRQDEKQICQSIKEH